MKVRVFDREKGHQELVMNDVTDIKSVAREYLSKTISREDKVFPEYCVAINAPSLERPMILNSPDEVETLDLRDGEQGEMTIMGNVMGGM